MSDRESLAELIKQADGRILSIPYIGEEGAEALADYIIDDGWTRPPCKVGGEIWVIEREDGEAVDVSCVQFLAKSKGCIIATSWINDYDLDETLEYHINETQNNFDTDLKIYPEEDCFLSCEEAEAAIKG